MMKSKKEKATKKHRDPRFWPWGLAAVAMGVVGGICILFWYTPRAYQPLPKGENEYVNLHLSNELAPQFYNEVQKCLPFDLFIQQSDLNEIISQEASLMDFGVFTFSEPQVIFLDDSILLMGTLTYEKISSVISITAFPTMEADGTINLNIQSICLGMVPVKPLITKLAKKALDENRDAFADDPIVEQIVEAIISNEPFEPKFPFGVREQDYWVQISNFTIEQQTLQLTLSSQKDDPNRQTACSNAVDYRTLAPTSK